MSCNEIRRLFWQLTLAVEQCAQAVLHWSGWRRWHQAWARYHHYRRRTKQTGVAVDVAAATAPPMAEGNREDELEHVWQRLKPLLPPLGRSGRPYTHDRRVVLEAIIYVMRTNCGWQHLPAQFPPWKTVYSQLTRWRATGVWKAIWAGIEQPRLRPNDELQL